MKINSQTIKNLAHELGFDLCGVAGSRPLEEHRERLERWLSADYHSGMGYMERNVEKRLDPSKLVDGARTVIVCGVNARNEYFGAESISPRIASYALAQDYHTTIRSRLEQLLAYIAEEYGARGRCFVDTAPILEKAWAVEAGLGWIGRNSLLVTPRFGTTVFLGECVVDVEADSYDTPYIYSGCGGCRACEQGCPSGAIVGHGVVDTAKCVARITTEKCGTEFVNSTSWIFGCDECQSCCPYNEQGSLHSLPEFLPVESLDLMDRKYWLSMGEEDFLSRFGATPLARVGLAVLQKRVKETCFL